MDHTSELNPFLYLARNAESNPSGVFIATADQVLRNDEALVYVKKIAYELRRIGVKPRHLVALDLPEGLSILFTMAAFHEAAATTVLPSGFAGTSGLSVDWVFSNLVAAAQDDSGATLVDSGFLQRVEQNPFGIRPRAFESGESLLRVVFSSGTTGTPNAIALTTGMLASHSENALDTWMQGDPFLLFLGTSTAMGFNGFYLSLQDNRPFVAVGNSNADAIVELADRYSVTSLKASPAHLASLVAELERQQRTLPTIQTAYVVGSVISPELSARLRSVTDGCEIYNLYGSTEATIAFARYYESDDPYDAGQLFPGSTVEIVDEDDNVLPEGQVGRIRHRHPQMVHEYLGNPEATRSSFRDGWFYPGDLGYLRPDKGLTLAGRASEILNAGGVKVDPTQLDLLALQQPNVVDACSFSYRDSAGTQSIGIALVTNDGVDVHAVIRNLDSSFGSAAPRLVARVDLIPRNAMGKPMRMALAERFAGS